MTPNATRILQKWGLADRLWPSAAEPRSLTVHRYTGAVLAHDDDFGRNVAARYGAPFLDMHRVDLQRALVARARELGVAFRLGEQVESIDLARAEVVTRAGAAACGDVVVAADGVWSKCLTGFLGGASPPLPTGDLAYRLVLDLEQAGDDPELREWVGWPSVHFWIGPGAHAVWYSMRAGTLFNLVLLVPDDLPEGVRRQPGNLAEMKALFKDWDPILKKFLDKVETVEKWRLMHSKLMCEYIHTAL